PSGSFGGLRLDDATPPTPRPSVRLEVVYAAANDRRRGRRGRRVRATSTGPATAPPEALPRWTIRRRTARRARAALRTPAYPCRSGRPAPTTGVPACLPIPLPARQSR